MVLVVGGFFVELAKKIFWRMSIII